MVLVVVNFFTFIFFIVLSLLAGGFGLDFKDLVLFDFVNECLGYYYVLEF